MKKMYSTAKPPPGDDTPKASLHGTQSRHFEKSSVTSAAGPDVEVQSQRPTVMSPATEVSVEIKLPTARTVFAIASL